MRSRVYPTAPRPPARGGSCRLRRRRRGPACATRSSSASAHRSSTRARVAGVAAVDPRGAARAKTAWSSTSGRRGSRRPASGPVMVWLHGGGFSSGSAGYHSLRRRRTWRASTTWSSSPSTTGSTCSASSTSPSSAARLRRRQQRRHARHRRGARVGARQHRALRRRPRQRHDLRPVGRRRKGQHADGHAGGEGPVPQGHRPERIGAHGRPAGRGDDAPPRPCSCGSAWAPASSTRCRRCRWSGCSRRRAAPGRAAAVASSCRPWWMAARCPPTRSSRRRPRSRPAFPSLPAPPRPKSRSSAAPSSGRSTAPRCARR